MEYFLCGVWVVTAPVWIPFWVIGKITLYLGEKHEEYTRGQR